MSKLLVVLLTVFAMSGCSTLMPLGQSGASKLADIKQAYCKETNPTVREEFRALYNAEMDKRGLPHDQINCPQ